MTGSGPVIVLPNKFADEIKNDPGLEFNKGIKQVWPVPHCGEAGMC